MTTWIAFLRAINVGGNNLIKMSDLRDLLAGLGLEDVRTHLQSGNALFKGRSKDRAKLSQEISAAIHAAHGHRPDIILRTPEELRHALDRVPFDASANPSQVLINFLAAPADPEGAKQ